MIGVLFLPLSQLVHFLSFIIRRCPFSAGIFVVSAPIEITSAAEPICVLISCNHFFLNTFLLMPIPLLFLLMVLNRTMVLVLPFFDKPTSSIESNHFSITNHSFLPHTLFAITSLVCHLSFSLTWCHITFDVWRLLYSLWFIHSLCSSYSLQSSKLCSSWL